MGKAIQRIQKRKKAINKLSELISRPEHVTVIHYSCESFYDRPDGSSPRITSIAALNLETRQARSFSIHQMAERKKLSYGQLEEHYNQLEKLMLDEFYEYVRSHTGYTWLHWNMRNINYGFEAIAHRYKVLGGHPVDIPEGNLVDLSHLLISIYGVKYIGHPRLPNLVDKNRISRREFLTGEEEAKAFENKEYVKLHQSTLRKVDVLASIAERAGDGTLKTGAHLKDIYGNYAQALGDFLREHWLISVIAFIGAVVSILTIFK